MPTFLEFQAQSSQDRHGAIRLNTTYVTEKKPVPIVLLKVSVLLLMLALGTAVIMPGLMLFLSFWQACVGTTGIVLIYIGAAFFLRPEANPDNMGWFGGLGNDPFQYSDNINRLLFQLHMFLGPGRFAAETLLDICALVGLARGAEVVEPAVPVATASDGDGATSTQGRVSPAAAAEPELKPDRFDVRKSVPLETLKYLRQEPEEPSQDS